MTGADLNGKVALVTGGASGIGRAASIALAAAGARVIVGDLNEQGARDTAHAIERQGGRAEAIALNIADRESVAASVARAKAAFGTLHIGVNCAGVTLGGGLLVDVPEENFDRTIAVNIKGTWHCMRAEIPAILESGGGAIVNISSTMGLIASPMASSYVASKHAVIGLTKAAALEYSAKGVRVNAICPGGTDTAMIPDQVKQALAPLHPIGRISRPEEIAAAIDFLASPAASFITGVALPVDGGWTTH